MSNSWVLTYFFKKLAIKLLHFKINKKNFVLTRFFKKIQNSYIFAGYINEYQAVSCKVIYNIISHNS